MLISSELAHYTIYTLVGLNILAETPNTCICMTVHHFWANLFFCENEKIMAKKYIPVSQSIRLQG